MQYCTRRYPHSTKVAMMVMVTATRPRHINSSAICQGSCLRKLAAPCHQRSNASHYSLRLRGRHLFGVTSHQPTWPNSTSDNSSAHNNEAVAIKPTITAAIETQIIPSHVSAPAPARIDGVLKPKKTVRFSRFERVFEAHSPSDYDRSSIAPRYEALLTWRRISNMTRINGGSCPTPQLISPLVGQPIVVVDSSADIKMAPVIGHGADLHMLTEKTTVYSSHTPLPLNEPSAAVWPYSNINVTTPTTTTTHVRSAVMQR
ncbi:hypothetical protein BDF19DRAFT_421482 [Syncephalis fuscata]|nr:hypothetical protein BDF19DRAFT_421482 [Syncephalis fuscata]